MLRDSRFVFSQREMSGVEWERRPPFPPPHLSLLHLRGRGVAEVGAEQTSLSSEKRRTSSPRQSDFKSPPSPPPELSRVRPFHFRVLPFWASCGGEGRPGKRREKPSLDLLH